MRPKLISHPFSVSKRSFGYWAPASAALIQSARHVDVHMLKSQTTTPISSKSCLIVVPAPDRAHFQVKTITG